MPVNFSNIQNFEVTADTTAVMDLDMIDLGGVDSATLTLRPATEANKPFAKAQLRMSNARTRGSRLRRQVNLKQLADAREDDRKLFPIHIIVSWTGVVDSNKKEVPFSVEACTDFIGALPNWVFDEVRAFALQAENFVTQETVDEVAVGNSSKRG